MRFRTYYSGLGGAFEVILKLCDTDSMEVYAMLVLFVLLKLETLTYVVFPLLQSC